MKFLIVLTILIVTNTNSKSQSIKNEDLFKLYNNNKIEDLKIKLQKIGFKGNSSPEIQFLNTIFMENGEEALKIYLKIFDTSYGDLKRIVAKKISDYYYAKGYYLTASKYQKFMVENTRQNKNTDNAALEKVEDKKYIIQLGAFGLEENAEQLKEMLKTQNIITRIQKRTINQKILYCVWLDGKRNFSETLQHAEKIKEKYHLKYRILQQ